MSTLPYDHFPKGAGCTEIKSGLLYNGAKVHMGQPKITISKLPAPGDNYMALFSASGYTLQVIRSEILSVVCIRIINYIRVKRYVL